jgi:hypothetical protein
MLINNHGLQYTKLYALKGILTAILTSPSVPIPINSVDDLVNQEEMGWGIEGGSIMEQIGSTAAEGTIFRWQITTPKMKQFSCFDISRRLQDFYPPRLSNTAIEINCFLLCLL